ncbi:hypothetical protein [Pedobacter sp. ASV28]|uniref:hypothetical protein n=1 Tax=Pedobacter sp. ASV28 TaxID=2795123 RepID=UPI0018EBE628|nr:hypothetical protein [Pedobacter sp. ASV28]
MKIQPKGLAELEEQLANFENDVTESIAGQLGQVGRTVAMEELNFVSFREDIKDYILAIRLDEEQQPVLDTSFDDLEEKHLSSCISDNEIGHWDLIALLKLLQQVGHDFLPA